MKEPSHPFDLLNQWRISSKEARPAEASEQDLGAMRRIVDLLVSPESRRKYLVSKERFPALVAEMRELYVHGSRTLGETMIRASELVEDGRLSDAISLYENFIDTSPSPFYKTIAESERSKLIKKSE